MDLDWNPGRRRRGRRLCRIEHGHGDRSQLRRRRGRDCGGYDWRPHHQHRKTLMNRIVVLLLWCAASATAESNVGAPIVGVMRDTHRQLRPVYGVAGNFVLREAIPKEALNWAFAGTGGGLMKTDAELLTLDSSGNVIGRR